MKKQALSLLLLLSVFSNAALAKESLYLYLFKQNLPIADVSVVLDGADVGVTDAGGHLSTELALGEHKVELLQGGVTISEFRFRSAAGESAEASVTLLAEGEPKIAIDTYIDGQVDENVTGVMRGAVVSRIGNQPIADANIYIETLQRTLSTDSVGQFAAELPRGSYDIVISHPNHGSREFSDVYVSASVDSNLTFRLSQGVVLDTPDMEELAVVATYTPVATSTIDIKRSASSVTDAIDQVQLDRFGGTTAAAALKRVAGVTLSQDKFVVVRGLNERHTAVTLNSSSLPSPDPSRRVVPLDIFPSTLLQGIEVQKAATPDQPADSTGGVVKLKTKRDFPEEFQGELTFKLGYVEDLTGKDRSFQPDESGDFFGFGADDRSLPTEAAVLQNLVPLGLATTDDKTAGALALDPAAMATQTTSVDPNFLLEIGLGDSKQTDRAELGYIFSFKYENQWSREDSQRRNYVNAGSDEIEVRDDFDFNRTVNDIDLGLGFTFGVIWGDHQIDSNTLWLRQSQGETNISSGLQGDNRNLQVKTEHRWNEREFLMQQFVGEHYIPQWAETDFTWNLSVSRATLESPDQREIVFRTTSPDDNPAVTFDDVRYVSARRSFVDLTDDNFDIGGGFVTQVFSNDTTLVKLNYGLSYFDRERDAETLRFFYEGAAINGLEDFTQIQDVINETTISNGQFLLSANTAPTDKYDATWELMAYYLSADIELGDHWEFLFGARVEDSDIIVNTFVDAPGEAIPEIAQLDENDVFPSLNLTYLFRDDLQLRFGYYLTKNRPDFRELSNAQFIDPETGDLFKGNPDLVSAEVDNLDVRLEWYFSDSEILTVGFFDKQFTDAIEKTVSRVGGGGEIFSFQNADDGFIRGLEIDFKKEFQLGGNYEAFISGNVSFIDSEVTIDSENETITRNMQGQPDNLFNLQAGLDDFKGNREYTLLLFHQGESIDSVSQGLPPVIREPRAELDFKFGQYLGEQQRYKLKVELKNILDDEVELTQGGQLYRKYKKGRILEVGVDIDF